MIYEFAATQDLHGYSEPWAPGAGNNLWGSTQMAEDIYEASPANVTIDSTNKTVTIASAAAITGVAITSIEFQESTQYTYILTGDMVSDRCNIKFKYTDETTSTTFIKGANVSQAGKTVENIILWQYSGDTVIDYETSGLFEGVVSADDFTPYANICMPEGFNIWDPENAEYVQIYAGYVNSNTRELLLRPVYSEYAGEELVGPWMSSMDKYEEDTTPTEGAFVIDFGGELFSLEITPFMLQTLLDSLGIRQHFMDGASLLNSLMDQAQGRVRSEDELLNRSRALKVIAIGDQLPAGLKFKPISKDVLPGLPGKFIR